MSVFSQSPPSPIIIGSAAGGAAPGAPGAQNWWTKPSARARPSEAPAYTSAGKKEEGAVARPRGNGRA